MPTLREWVEKCASGQPVEAVVIGEMGWGDYGSDAVPNYAQCPKGKLLTWEEALPWLSYEFSAEFDAPGCQAIYAWTKDFVVAISQYDGSTGAFAMPRHPIECMPDITGG